MRSFNYLKLRKWMYLLLLWFYLASLPSRLILQRIVTPIPWIMLLPCWLLSLMFTLMKRKKRNRIRLFLLFFLLMTTRRTWTPTTPLWIQGIRIEIRGEAMLPTSTSPIVIRLIQNEVVRDRLFLSMQQMRTTLIRRALSLIRSPLPLVLRLLSVLLHSPPLRTHPKTLMRITPNRTFLWRVITCIHFWMAIRWFRILITTTIMRPMISVWRYENMYGVDIDLWSS